MKKIKLFETAQTTEALVAEVGMGFLLLVFPFVFRNGYTDITGVRFLFYTVLSAFTLIGCAVPPILRQKTLPRLSSPGSVRKYPLTAAFLLFLNALCLSAAFSPYRAASLTGSEGRFMGLLTYLAFAMTFFWISRWYVLSERTLLAFCGVCSVIAFLALLQFVGLDLFYLLRPVALSERRNFLSVFGNINVYAAYLSAAAPVAMLMSCFAERRNTRILFLVFSFFGFIGLLTSNSDSCYIAFGTALFLLFLPASRSQLTLKRYVLLLAAFFGALIVFSAVFNIAGGQRGRSGITELLTSSFIPYAGAAMCGVAYFAVARLCGSEKRLRILRIAVIAAVCLALAALLGAVIWFSAFDTAADIGYPEKYLRFNDRWGTDRGYVWRRLLHIYRDSPVREKLFGYGEDTIAVLMLNSYGREMISTLGYLFDNAHNEFLQYLVTTGLFGLVSYLLLLAAAWKTGFAKDAPVLKKALALATAAYAAQSFFNLLQPISTPYLFMLIGLIGCRNVIPSTVIDTNQINASTTPQEDTSNHEC